MTAADSSPFSKGRIEALSDGVFAIAMTLIWVQPLACVAAIAVVFIEPPRGFMVFAVVQALGQVTARRLSARLRNHRAAAVVSS